MKLNFGIVLLILISISQACTKQQELKTSYLKEGKLENEIIEIGQFVEMGCIKNQYIDTVTFGILDSITYKDNNPNKSTRHQTAGTLDFSKHINKYSPEYYALYSTHHISKALNYYTQLFHGKLDFNSQQSYKSIEIVFGNAPLFTNPKNYIIEPGSNPSPSLFYHEVGHRAFWLIEDQLKLEFNGLSIIHMGLLEYFTVSLNNSPLVGEDVFRGDIIRDASFQHTYPLDESYKLDYTFNHLLKNNYAEEMNDPNSIFSRYYKACIHSYAAQLKKRIDNHRGGMLLSSTLWRIRQQIGQAQTDKLVAETILKLNDYKARRAEFYISEDDLQNKIWWYDVFFGLIDQDQQINAGKNRDVIIQSFRQANYPIERISLKDMDLS